ncbi:hypothetical protein J4733_00985 [Klebsiella pneumoniae]|uniref:Uncharacterized protein n=1 Tax=Klebsiella pneumoniae TaxID=573 RepID=A0A939NN51_KLEPN|nr:hypothetical protein [Klebsiella pneumoniae]
MFEGCFSRNARESHSRPGKRSAAGEDTTGAIPPLCRMALRLSGLRSLRKLPRARQAQPPGRTPAPYLPLCRMAASPYPAYGILP